MDVVENIRDGTRHDIPVLEELQRRASWVWEEYRERLAAHPDAIAIPPDAVRDGHVRVACRQDRPVGFSVAIPISDEVWELDGLFVEPDTMRHGVGRSLVADVTARAAQTQVRVLEVTANPHALGFYEKQRFRFSHSVPTRFGPGLRMRRPISR